MNDFGHSLNFREDKKFLMFGLIFQCHPHPQIEMNI